MNAAVSPATTTSTAATATKKTSKVRGPKTSSGSITLGELGDRFLKHLEQQGRSRGTTFSYELDLAIAKTALGANTAIDSLTPERVQKFFESDVVTKTRKGRAKAKPTVDKTRRVLRLALAWAAEKKMIDTAPLPNEGKVAGEQA